MLAVGAIDTDCSRCSWGRLGVYSLGALQVTVPTTAPKICLALFLT